MRGTQKLSANPDAEPNARTRPMHREDPLSWRSILHQWPQTVLSNLRMVATRDLLACAKNLFVSAMRSVERARKRALRITTFKVEHGSNLVSPPGRRIR
jgi:hypothetical protein